MARRKSTLGSAGRGWRGGSRPLGNAVGGEEKRTTKMLGVTGELRRELLLLATDAGGEEKRKKKAEVGCWGLRIRGEERSWLLGREGGRLQY
ncbi:unnamed protein product [Linum trigynum]|uniref:Uncharacterized protein n=1 Tax=Linum trigynum TaxID=586398 RepID=A0AAV2G7Q5_9ROSI